MNKRNFSSSRLPGKLSVGQVSERSGVAVSALHFYESKGLIASERDAINRRIYRPETLRHVSLIKVAQKIGLPLAAIRAAFGSLPTSRPPTATDWKRLSSEWKEDLDRRIATLEALRDQLDQCIGCGCLSLDDCPLRNPDDVLGQKGPGPHLLEPVDPQRCEPRK